MQHKMRKLLSVLLALVMVMGLALAMSQTARADDAGYDLWVGGERVTDENCGDVLGDGGSVKFDPSTNTLTLTNAKITGDVCDELVNNILFGILSTLAESLTLELAGENSISVDSQIADHVYGIRAEVGGLTVVGGGSLDVTADNNSINSINNSIYATYMTVKSGTVTAKIRQDLSGYGVMVEKKLTMEGGSLVAEGGYGPDYIATRGIHCESFDLKGGRVEARGGAAGISCNSIGVDCKYFNMTGGALVAEGGSTNGTDYSLSYGVNVDSNGNFYIGGGVLEARGVTRAFFSANLPLDGYLPDRAVTVSGKYDMTALKLWNQNDMDALGGDSSPYKYVKIAPTPRAMVLGTGLLAVAANTDNAATVYFGLDHEDIPGPAAWRVAGYDGEGAASSAGDMTLLAAGNMGTTTFGSKNEYAGSALQNAVEELAGKLEDWESYAVKTKTLMQGGYNGIDTDGVAGAPVENALLWPLSTAEANKVDHALRASVSNFWLRSPGSGEGGRQRADIVKGDGTVDAAGEDIRPEINICPAMNIDLENVLFISPASGGRTDNDNLPYFQAVKSYDSWYTAGWKLTVFDPAREDFTALAVERNAAEVVISYSDAATGDGEYLSAVIADDATGEITHYARLLQLNSDDRSSGTYTVSLYDESSNGPIDMTGKSLYVFNEHLSGAEKTDCASRLMRIGEPYGLFVGGVSVTSENCDDIKGPGISCGNGGKVSYDPIKRKLTFSGAGPILVENAHSFALTKAEAQRLTEKEYNAYEKHVPSAFWKAHEDTPEWNNLAPGDEVFALTAGIFVGRGIGELTVRVTGGGSLYVRNSEYPFGVGIYAPLTELVFDSDDDSEAEFRGNIGIYAQSLSIQGGKVYGRGKGSSAEYYGVWSEGEILVSGGCLSGYGADDNYVPGIRAASPVNVTDNGVLIFPKYDIEVGGNTYTVGDIDSAVYWDESTHALFTGELGAEEYRTVVHPIELNSIAVTTQPNKTAYKPGDSFDPTGMKITAYYNARYGIGNHTLVRDKDTFAVDVTDKATVTAPDPLKASEKTVTVSFTDDGKTVTAEVPITIAGPSGGGGGGTQYTLSYETNGGSEVKTTTHINGTTVNLTATPTKEGYTFDGWYADEALTSKITSVKMDENKTVYAGWKENEKPKTDDHECPSAHLKDVDENAWYHEYIDYVVEKGLMEGMADDLFGPNVTTSRAMIVAILYRLEGKPAVTGTSPFDDVKDGRWYTDAIIWANRNGIVEGYGNGKFGPSDLITREQFAAIMYRYANFKGYDVSVGQDTNILSYDDASEVSDWAMEAMQWAVGSGLITGRTETTLVPKGNATRAEAAAILMRFIENVK